MYFLFVGEVGFLAEDRRINVAVTRARRHLAVICDSQTVQSHAFLKSLVGHMTEHGEVRTAFEYLQDIVPLNYTRSHNNDIKTRASAASSAKQKVKQQPADKATQKTQKKPAGAKVAEDPVNQHTRATKPRILTPEEELKAQTRYAEIRQQVETYLRDPSREELQFPPSLNSHDRMLVHQISEELGLGHESRGEGRDRCITVSRPPPGSGPTEGAVPPTPPEPEEEEEEEEEEQAVSEPQAAASSQQPFGDLKSLHLERMKREQQRREEAAQQKRQVQAAIGKLPTAKKPAKGERRSYGIVSIVPMFLWRDISVDLSCLLSR